MSDATKTGESPVKTGRKQADTQFKPGQSGNPRGRPPGARSKATLLAEATLEGQLEQVVGKIVDKAIEGDMTAARMVLDRLMPAGRSRKIRFTLPPLKTSRDVAAASAALVGSVVAGNLAADEAIPMQQLLRGHVDILQTPTGYLDQTVEFRGFDLVDATIPEAAAETPVPADPGPDDAPRD
jgi:hypothetical protein